MKLYFHTVLIVCHLFVLNNFDVIRMAEEYIFYLFSFFITTIKRSYGICAIYYI